MLTMKKRFAHLALYVGATTFFITLVYFALLADAFYSGGDAPKAPQMAQMIPSLPLEIHEAEAEMNDVLISHPKNGAELESERIEVNGKAPRESTVQLFLNGAKIAQVESRDGSYWFENVELAKQANVIQTRFHSRDGSSAPSKPILVFHRIKTSNLEGK
jgi:hypothetical protein